MTDRHETARPAGKCDQASSREVRFRASDRLLNKTSIWLAQGEFKISSSATEVLTTVLGSCIAVCICDPDIGCGGMNHFLLPESPRPIDGLPSLELRYGSYSIERLINAILARGGRRDRLQIKVFGGGNIMGTSNIGHGNADFVEDYMRKEGFNIAAKDLRGTLARKVHYFPTTGLVLVSHPRGIASASIVHAEGRAGLRQLLPASAGTVEIFQVRPIRRRAMTGS